jgi:hypothetical protein
VKEYGAVSESYLLLFTLKTKYPLNKLKLPCQSIYLQKLPPKAQYSGGFLSKKEANVKNEKD